MRASARLPRALPCLPRPGERDLHADLSLAGHLADSVSFAFYLGTGKAHYKRLGLLLFKWTVIAGLAFFAVMLVGRII